MGELHYLDDYRDKDKISNDTGKKEGRLYYLDDYRKPKPVHIDTELLSGFLVKTDEGIYIKAVEDMTPEEQQLYYQILGGKIFDDSPLDEGD